MRRWWIAWCWFIAVLLGGCVSDAAYRSLAKSYQGYIKETAPVYLLHVDNTEPLESVRKFKHHFVRDSKRAADAAVAYVGTN